MKRLNPKTKKFFVKGDIRSDGFIFTHYSTSKIIKSTGYFKENWLSPERYKYYTSKEYNKKRWRNTLKKLKDG